LTRAARLEHLLAMAARFPLLATLRRSMIGAWLACAYALAVVAAGLAPSPAAAWPAELGAAQFCSGDAAPGSETPSEPAHCKGCLASWPVALPPDVTAHAPLLLPVVDDFIDGISVVRAE